MKRYRVVEKQKSSKLCFVCGVHNEGGLETEFFALENGDLVSYCTPREKHQSYPGRVHGGVSAAILDETIGRAIMNHEPGIWGVTVELELKYKKPVPYDVTLKAVGRVTENKRLLFKGEGELYLPNGEVAVEAKGRYMKMPIDRIVEAAGNMDEEMFLVPHPDDPTEIELED